LFLLFAMEEVSWFQRRLGLETPALVARHNLQGELNLHNLWSSQLTNLVYLGWFGAFFLVAPVLQWAPSRGALAARLLFFSLGGLCIAYVLMGQQQAYPGVPGYVPEAYRPITFGAIGLACFACGFGAERVLSVTVVRALLRRVLRDLKFSPQLFRSAAILSGVYLAWALRFQSIWDLQLGIGPYGIAVDDEMIEFSGAVLSCIFVCDQFREPPVPGPAPHRAT
jgi:hypothetical protein